MSSALFDLSGKVALVSGAAQGMGRAMALALAEAGADVMLVDRNSDGTKETAGLIEKYHRRAVVAGCAVSDTEQIRHLFKRLDAEYALIDFLGYVQGVGVSGRSEDSSIDVVDPSRRNLMQDDIHVRI